MRMRLGLSAASIAALAVAVVAVPCHADERARYALDMSGVRYGMVRATVERENHLVLGAQEIAPSFVALVDAFAQGKPVKRDVRLTSGAVVRKAEGAKLLSVRLPALGSGGAPDVELVFAAPTITTSPLLSAKEAPPPPPSAKIASFRVELTGMQAIEAPKVDAITLTQKADGAPTTTGEITIEVAAGGAPPFAAWQKKPAPKTFRIEYVGAEGATVLKLQLDRCTPSSVKPLGASGTTRITLACASVKNG